MFMRKHWIGLTVLLIAVIGVGVYYRQTQLPKAPIVIYRATTPISKTVNRVENLSNTQPDKRAVGLSETGARRQDAIHIAPVDLSQPLDDFGFFDDALVRTEVIASETEVIPSESPFGYGPYPEIPADYPWNPIWTFSAEKRKGYSDNDPEMERVLELMSRVAIKVWKSGRKDFKGQVFSRGRVYLNFPNTVYAEISELGYAKRVRVIGTGLSEEEIANIGKGINPAGITVFDMSEGIEPISFLEASAHYEVNGVILRTDHNHSASVRVPPGGSAFNEPW